MTDGDHDDLIERLREDLGAAEKRIHDLEQTLSVYGETLEALRTRVYALEHGVYALDDGADETDDDEPDDEFSLGAPI